MNPVVMSREMNPSDMKAFDLPSQPPANFSLVLVNYKTPDITRMCLELLREHVQAQRIPVWVVDNDSADASLDYLRSLDWINLIERPSPGKEAGILRMARRWIWLWKKLKPIICFCCTQTLSSTTRKCLR